MRRGTYRTIGETGHRGLRPLIRLYTMVAGLALGLTFATATMAGDPSFLAISVGGYDVNDNETAAEARIEFRWNEKFLGFKPTIGLLGNSKGGIYGYGGINLDIFLGNRWVLMPNFAIGGYRRGSSKDLGNVLEFRSGLELAYRFDDRARLGVALSHISNASLSNNNPGTESLVLTYSIPIGN